MLRKNQNNDQSIGVIFVIMHDEVTDASNVQQLGSVLRYTKGKEIKEQLFEYVSFTRITEEAIYNKVLGILQNANLSPVNCRPETYDVAGNMAGQQKYCVTRFQSHNPRTPYFHCPSRDVDLIKNFQYKRNLVHVGCHQKHWYTF